MSGKNKNVGLKATIVIVISLVGILGTVELGLRVLEASGSYPWLFQALGKARPPLDKKTGPGMYYAHHYSGYAMKPNYERVPFERINNLGFRGEDIKLEKPDGVYRIVAIGGSTTFAVYLPWNE